MAKIAATQLKLKQASAVLRVSAKDLQNFVQFGVLRPSRRGDVFWFDTNLLLQAKIAFYLKESLGPSSAYLAELTKELSRVNLMTIGWKELVLSASPGKGKPSLRINIPLNQLKSELDDSMPLAEIIRDLPRGRKRRGWKKEFIATLQEAGDDLGKISDQEILSAVRDYRSGRKKKPEIKLVSQASRTA